MDPEILKRLGEIQTEAKAAILGLQTDWKVKYDELKAAGAPVDDIKLQLERAIKRLESVEQEISRPIGSDESALQVASAAKRLIDMPELKEWVDRVGRTQKSTYRYATPTLFSGLDYGMRALDNHDLKTVITSVAVGNSTPGIIVPQRMPGIVKPGVRRIRVRDLIPRFPTTSNTIEWVKENAFTNRASPQTETVSKAESELTFTIDSVPVRTIAHWIPAAKQVLDDFSQLQAYVETRLLEGLKDVEDNEIINGDGSGQHLSGFTLEGTAYDTGRNAVGDTRIDVLNHAISQIEDVLQEADGIVLHPRDWRAIQLVKTDAGGANTGEYLLGGPAGNATPVLWGLPVATTTAVGVGTFWVGAFQRYTALFDRMDARIDVSTEHADYFIRNMVAIRAEQRLALVVQRADSLVFGTF